MRVSRDGDTHGLADLNVSVALSGDLAATHLTGDNAGVLPTDTMKNTVYAFARSTASASRRRSGCCWPGISWRPSRRSARPR